jgi:hypothetical protein
LFKHNDLVSVIFVNNVSTASLYTNNEILKIVKNKNNASKLLSSVFTTEFESAIVSGTLYEVLNQKEKERVLSLIYYEYIPDK